MLYAKERCGCKMACVFASLENETHISSVGVAFPTRSGRREDSPSDLPYCCPPDGLLGLVPDSSDMNSSLPLLTGGLCACLTSRAEPILSA